MSLKQLEIFVPGRLCLLGEHSDWASNYKNINSEIDDGFAVVALLNDGIHAKVKIDNKIFINFMNEKKIEVQCIESEIDKIIKKDNFWKYIFGAVKYMIKTYNVGGINVYIDSVTLPMKKGLGSSATISLLIVKAYNLLYNLELNDYDETTAAYYSEVNIGSKCGKLDQISKSKNQVKLLHFNNNNGKENVITEQINVYNDIFMVYVDLKGNKETIKILDDLNSCYPNYKNDTQKNVHDFLGKKNKDMVLMAKKYMEFGDNEKLGKLLSDYQRNFDKYLIPVCEELKAPILHNLLNDKVVRILTYGGKGCGSGGDGAAQFIAKDENSQKELVRYLNEELKLEAKPLTIKGNKIKKAIIPVGGYGTRMYPMTKIIGKEFLPLFDSDGKIKPAIFILLNELISSGIEKIGLVMPKEYQMNYKKFFINNKSYSMFENNEKELENIFSKLVFINDEKQNGLCNALKLSENFIGNDSFMLVLGDQIYKSNTDVSCISQILDFYYIKRKPIISVCKTELEKTVNYGILKGDKINKCFFEIQKFMEKPKLDVVKSSLFTLNNGNKEYYSVFGNYIFDNRIFKLIDESVEFSDVLKAYIETYKPLAFIPNGRYYDIGNNESYNDAIINFNRRSCDNENS